MYRARTSVLSTLCLWAIVLSPAANAQTFSVLHSFTGGTDGANPWAGLTMDRAGNLYGAAMSGGTNQLGTVFKLSHSEAGWTFNPLYSFAGSPDDGNSPVTSPVFGPNGTLYGVTSGGGPIGFGTAYNVTPPARICSRVLCPWNETVIHEFPDPMGVDGFYPTGSPLFDQTGEIYGTTMDGPHGGTCGGNGCGVAYKLTQSQGTWTENIVYTFNPAPDSNLPQGGLIFGSSGNLYGTACEGGTHNYGTVFQMTTSGVESILYNFQNESDGQCPAAALIFDTTGNLYSTASNGGASNGGTAFELMSSNGNWDFVLLYSFGFHALPSALTMDSAGNLYGTTYAAGAFGYGAVFKLTHSQSGWTYTSLHDFTNGADGANPVSGVIFDANGNLYGTASQGAQQICFLGCGVVWEITP